MARPKIFKLGVQTSIYIEHKHKQYLDTQGMNISSFIRDVIDEAMQKIDLYKELQQVREELVKVRNENLMLLKEIDIINKANIKKEKEAEENRKLKLSENDSFYLKNPDKLINWLDLYDNHTISEQSFISKVKMSPNRAKKLKQEYIY